MCYDAVPITKLFAREGGGNWRTCEEQIKDIIIITTRDYEPRPM
jgi:hypothetical protein